MHQSLPNYYKYILVLPGLGMLGFILLYVLSTFQYPGGSYEALQQPGFNWQYNYLCDLLDTYAVNGEQNPAHITSRIALGFLCIGIAVLWYVIPLLFPFNKTNYYLIRISGIASMITVVFLAFGGHDLVVRIAGIFGLIALVATFRGLYTSKYYGLLIYGCIALVLVVLNFYIYESTHYIYWLPLIQKITFVCFIGWFATLNLKLYKKLTAK